MKFRLFVCSQLGILTRWSFGAETWHTYVFRLGKQDFFTRKSRTPSLDRKLAGNRVESGPTPAVFIGLGWNRRQSTRLDETQPMMCILHHFDWSMTGS